MGPSLYGASRHKRVAHGNSSGTITPDSSSFTFRNRGLTLLSSSLFSPSLLSRPRLRSLYIPFFRSAVKGEERDRSAEFSRTRAFYFGYGRVSSRYKASARAGRKSPERGSVKREKEKEKKNVKETGKKEEAA